LGKNVIVRTLQKAFLDAWIGDYENAEKLLAEIEKTNSEISYLLQKTVKERKKKILEEKKFGIIMKSAYTADICEKPKQLSFLPDEFQNAKVPEELVVDYSPLTCWKYSATITSKVDSDLRVEFRGYNPNGQQPNLMLSWTDNQIRNWRVKKENDNLTVEQTSLVNFFAASEDPAIKLHFSVDIWGLLNGVAIIEEKNISVALIHVDYLFSKIISQLWSQQ